MDKSGNKSYGKRERGIALLISIFALVLLAILGITLIYMADSETMINANYRDSQAAYFAAYAGLQEVRERLGTSSTSPITPPVGLPSASATANVIYVLNPKPGETIAPWSTGSILSGGNKFFDDELCHEGFNFGSGVSDTGANVPCTQAPSGSYYSPAPQSTNPYYNTSANLDFKWVRITEKVNGSSAPFYVDGTATLGTVPICWDGTQQMQLPGTGYNGACNLPLNGSPYMEPVYRLTSLAVTKSGSRRMLQMEVADNPPLVTNAAVDSQDYVTLNGQLTVNAYDNCNCQCTTTNGVKTCGGTGCDNTKWAIYSASTVDSPNRSENLVSGYGSGMSAIPSCSQSPNTGCPWNYDIGALVQQYASSPNAVDATGAPYNYSCSGTPLDCGTHTSQTFGVPPTFPPSPPSNPVGPSNMSPQITYVPGDLKITGGSVGNGILVVDGDLEINGGLQFYGLILVKGVVKFTGGGSNPTNVYGAVLAGQQSIDDTVLGGSASLYFDSCALKRRIDDRPPSMLSIRELSY